MAKRQFLMLAHPFKPEKHAAPGWYMSEKLDGQRAFWDGGVSRGILKSEVPWANTAKDSRYVTPPVATGLWSRYGNVIHAPDQFLDALPAMPLDGELFIRRGRGGRQELSSIIKKLSPDLRAWSSVRLYAFDIPPLERVFQDGRVNVPNYQKLFTECLEWLEARDFTYLYRPKETIRFRSVVTLLQRHLEGNDKAIAHEQVMLPYQTEKANAIINEELNRITDLGGEGLMLRNPASQWVPERTYQLLKVKKLHDDEATVIGYTTGRQTDKGSKLLGLMGALIVRLKNGKVLELSGFTDEERTLNNPEWASAHPGATCPDDVEAIHFPRGSQVTFRYRDLTRDGIPQEARFWRRYDHS